MRRILLTVLLLGAGLAGCIGDDGTGPAEGTGPGDASPENNTLIDDEQATLPDGTLVPLAVQRAGCAVEIGSFPVPMAVVEQFGTSGEPVPFRGVPGTATFVIVATTCQDALGEPASELWAYVEIVPPASLPETEASTTLVPIGSFVQGERLLSLYEAWQVPGALEGEATVETIKETPAARAGHALGNDGSFWVHLYTAAPGQASPQPADGLRVVGFEGEEPSTVTEVTWPEHQAFEGTAKTATEGEPDPVALLLDGLEGTAYAIPGPVPLNTTHTRRAAATGANATAAFEQVDRVEAGAHAVLTGFHGGEPSIGILPDGTIFAQAGDDTVRSTDGGATWAQVYNYTFESLSGPRGTYDPMLWVDRATETVYWNHMRPNAAGGSVCIGVVCTPSERCTVIGWSTDAGESWERNDHACGTNGVDFQKLSSGPPGPGENPMAGVEHASVLYLCYNKQLPGVSTYDTHCSVSYDGGASWPVESRTLDCPGCGGGAGRVTTVADGTAYLPLGGMVGVSTDSGLTWTTRQGPPGMWIWDLETTPDGTLYALGIAGDGERTAQLARSTDGAASWEGPWRASPPGIDTAAFLALATGDDGNLGVAIIGTNHSSSDPLDVPDDARWHVHTILSKDADTAQPSFEHTQATEDPVQVGPICNRGSCSDTGARNLLDFIDASVHPDGTFYVAYTDGCTEGCANAANPEPEDSRDDATAVAWIDGWDLRKRGGA